MAAHEEERLREGGADFVAQWTHGDIRAGQLQVDIEYSILLQLFPAHFQLKMAAFYIEMSATKPYSPISRPTNNRVRHSIPFLLL